MQSFMDISGGGTDRRAMLMNFSAASHCQRVCSLGQRLLVLHLCCVEPILDITHEQTRALFCECKAAVDRVLTLRHRCVIALLSRHIPRSADKSQAWTSFPRPGCEMWVKRALSWHFTRCVSSPHLTKLYNNLLQ